MGRRKSKEELEELTRTQVLNLQELEKAAKFEKKTSRKPAYFLAILGVFSISLGLCYPSITNMLSSRGGEDREVVSEQRQETVEEERLDIVYPINKEGRKMIEDAVLAEYEKVLEEDPEE